MAETTIPLNVLTTRGEAGTCCGYDSYSEFARIEITGPEAVLADLRELIIHMGPLDEAVRKLKAGGCIVSPEEDRRE